MKEEDSNPLEPVGDEPIEARIVAWVLGDASAFEAAELERLCEERPELLVFRRRMQALHGLLSEAEAARPDDAWKLPAGKRAKIEELFSAMHAAPANVVVAKRYRQPWIRQALMAAAACLVLAAGFRYVFAPAANLALPASPHAKMVVSLEKDLASERMTPRPRQIAEGYASSRPVLPEIANLDTDVHSMPALQGGGGFSPGMSSGGGRGGAFGVDGGARDLARNENIEGKKGAKAPAKPSTASSTRAAQQALGSGLAFSAPASPPSAAPAPSRPQGAVAAKAAPARDLEEAGQLTVDEPAALAASRRAGDYASSTGIAAGGLRSGDGAITRNNIDAVLNNPNRVAGDKAPQAGLERADVAKVMNDTDATAPADSFAFAFKDEATKAKPSESESRAAARAWAGENQGQVFYHYYSEADHGGAVAQDNLQIAGEVSSNRSRFSEAPPTITANGKMLFPTESEPPPANAIAGKLDASERQTAPAEANGGFQGLAQREMRRQEGLAKDDQLLSEGRDAYARGDYQAAVTKYKQAIEQLPSTPATEERLKSYNRHLADGQLAQALDYEKQGKVEEAKKVLDEVVSSDPENLDAKREAAYLNDPIRNNADADKRRTENVEKVRKGLYMGEGNFNLGRYDEAKKEYEEVLRTDPYNSAARRMMERIAAANSDYYRAAYDHSRSELLMQTDRAWELAVPAEPDKQAQPPVPDAKPAGQPASVESLKKTIQEQEAQLALADDRLSKVKILGQQEHGAALERSIDSTDYVRAKGDLEASQARLAAMRARSTEEMAKMKSSPKASDEGEAAKLGREVQAAEDRVEENRKLLTNILRTKQIILTGQESIYRSDINEDDRGAASASETANKLEQEKIQLESQIQTLQTYNDDQLLRYASGLNLPENILKTMYPQYLEQQRALAQLKTEGLDDRHPTVQAQTQALARTKQQLDDGVASLRDTLRAQSNLADDRLAKIRALAGDSAQFQRAKLAELKKQLAIAEAAAAAIPKPAPVQVDETVAAAEPFSTFSLHVSDASFKLAKAALDRGERLSADQIRAEEFYNAFDYGDPAPAPGEPVACTIEQAAHPVLPQRNLVRVAMRVGSAGRGQGQPLNLTLLLDNSGSMERDDRHEGLKAAISQLASLLQPGDTVTLAGFSRTPHLLADRLSGADAAKLVELVDKLPSEGGTNLEEALKLAGDLAVQRKNPAAQNRIVLLTDGAANLGNAQPEDLAEKVAALRQQGIAFDAAGIGAGGLNDRMLEALTRHGNGRYYIVNDPQDADANFAKQLAGAFRPAAENVKVQVHFNPERVSRYKLIGFEKHRLNTEDFRNDAVDAAELAADEAGVALYQVETIPGGTGEIGEVSVRFRDTASSRMVENTWTIPHDEKTPAFDQARPSIQLATLAMLAAEKLRGGPLADATDFTTLAPVISRVKTYYSTSSRVGELTGMTGKLR